MIGPNPADEYATYWFDRGVEEGKKLNEDELSDFKRRAVGFVYLAFYFGILAGIIGFCLLIVLSHQ